MNTLTLSQACHALLQGELLIYPTETFMGLGCDAHNPDAVGKVFALKKRTLTLPLPVIIGAIKQLESIACDIPDMAYALMKEFWPGPLSLILPANPSIPDLLIANTGHIAVRFSSHSAAQELCKKTGRVLVASSANLSGEPPARTVKDLPDYLLSQTAGIYYTAPEPQGGFASTIVTIRTSRKKEVVQILRQGAISQKEIAEKGFELT